MAPATPDKLDQLEKILQGQIQALEVLTLEVKHLNETVGDLKQKFKGWKAWLRTAI